MIVSGPGEQEILDPAKWSAISPSPHSLHAVFEMVTHATLQNKERTRTYLPSARTSSRYCG